MTKKDDFSANLVGPDSDDIPMTSIKTKIIVMPADEPRQMKLGWTCSEIGLDGKLPDGSHVDDHFKPEECFATDLADQYKTYHHKEFTKQNTHGWMSIPVLEFLKGRPWDNMALNMVRALRPSYIRVTQGVVTSDAHVWRVTVFLEPDERTIRSIEQEVEVGTHGIRNGRDAWYYMTGREIPKHTPAGIVNPRGVRVADKLTKIE